jgi:hypothetical protein
MPKRALIAIATFGLVATACISSSTPAINYGTGSRFVPFVVDSLDNVGQGDAVALTADGVPYVSYFGFPAELAKGEIATPRPFGSPTVPAVMLATSTTDGLWQRGAVEMDAPPPALDPGSTVAIPFGPVKTEGLDLETTNTNGTALVVDDAGSAHMAWTVGSTVRYATSKLGGTATVETVFKLPHAVTQAGPVGRPSIAVDADGTAWVSFAIDTAKGTEVHVAHQEGNTWVDAIAASFPACPGCPAPQPTGIGVVGGSPVVVYADPGAKQVRAATLDGTTWTEATLASSVTGFGLSFSVAGDTAYAAYYTGNGTVEVATGKGGSWSTAKVSDAQDPDPTATGDAAPNTTVAATEDGTIYVGWEDDGVQLWSGTDSFAPVDIGTTLRTGSDPALATSKTGVALGWYDTTGQDQMIGYLADLADVVVARPSPSFTVTGSTGGGGECGGKTVVLDTSATSSAGFETTCLVAPADEKFTITFDNQDTTLAHNVHVLSAPQGKSFGLSKLAIGPVKETVPPLSLPAGSYFFQCDAHPTTMTGTLAVVKGAK